jgi:predicted nucleic acid-binding protein
MIQVFQDKKNNEYYALLSDFFIELIFPKYLLHIIKNEYENKSKSDQVLLEYLNVLEDAYMEYKSKIKSS